MSLPRPTFGSSILPHQHRRRSNRIATFFAAVRESASIARTRGASLLPTVEFEVDTSADHALSEFDRVVRSGQIDPTTRRRVTGCVAKIDEEIFDLGGPVVGKGPLDACSGGPAKFGGAL